MQTETNDLRNEHRRGLAEHGGLCFDSADAPAEDAQGIDHGSVGIRAHDRIGISLKPVAVRHGADDSREVFQIHLVADSGVWWNDFEVLKRRLPPAQERVALDVTLKLQLRI